jgi:hypothetical protein
VDLDEVGAYARDRLGMDPQAITPFGAWRRDAWTGHVWRVMTERGTFWLVEDGGAAELFLAAVTIGTAATAARYPTPALAVARFRELHPADPRAAATPAPAAADGPIRFTCRACGVVVGLWRRSAAAEPALCRRCRNAERERERYRTDPEYRARHLAYCAAYYRRVRRKDPA